MCRATNPSQLTTFVSRILMMMLCIGIGLLNSACASSPSLSGHSDFFMPFEGNPASSKSIFVFLDGTANDASSGTNVWRLFNQLKRHKNQQTIGYYIPGVGSIEEPLEGDPFFEVFGDALGRGMQARILEGYDFISEHYRSGDEIFIFGFSRGAHQARALAGLIAYSGMPANVSANKSDRQNKYE